METKYGYIHPRIVIGKDYVLGGHGDLGGEVIRPDGQWDMFLPKDEVQNLNGIEPFACAAFGWLNIIETLIKEQYGEERNYSDRFLAKATDTDKKMGNDPHVVAEFIRLKGVVKESDWGFDSFIDTFAKFYAPVPAVLYSIALELTAEFDFFHEYVPTSEASLKDALTKSPLGVAVYAWQQDFEKHPEGYYVTPQGAQPNHWCVLYGYEPGQYWKVFDSYDNTHKQLAWEYNFFLAKRAKIDRHTNVASPAWWSFLNTLWSWWPFGPKPTPPAPLPSTPPTVPSTIPPAPEPVKVDLNAFCLAIRTYEGWKPGSRSYRNNNPGNCRYSSIGYASVYLPVTKDKDGFAVFNTYAKGWLYLQNLVRERIVKHPKWTFEEFFAVYAPSNDGNDPARYAAWVAKTCGVDVTTTIDQITSA